MAGSQQHALNEKARWIEDRASDLAFGMSIDAAYRKARREWAARERARSGQ